MSKKLKDYGLDGIECVYSTHSKKDQFEINRIATKYNLKITGGSDFHGSNKKHIDLGVGTGGLFVPYQILENLKNR
jgi:predicted metal-dependent phosphoesterase TrpH